MLLFSQKQRSVFSWSFFWIILRHKTCFKAVKLTQDARKIILGIKYRVKNFDPLKTEIYETYNILVLTHIKHYDMVMT
nr:MAG TPA: hypothetical protein [Inoviridae sp.]